MREYLVPPVLRQISCCQFQNTLSAVVALLKHVHPSGIRQQLGVHVLSVYIVILSLSLAVRLFSREIWAVETPNPDRIAKKGSTTSDWLGRKRGSPVGAGSGRWRKFFHGSEGITFQLFLGRKRHI